MAKRIYADSGIFIAHLNGEEQYSAECADILEAAQAGLVELHTSYVSMTEVLKRRTESLRRGADDERAVSEFMDEDFIRYSALEAVVASYARYVVWDTRAQVRDAIHLATGMQRNCEYSIPPIRVCCPEAALSMAVCACRKSSFLNSFGILDFRSEHQ
jgi:predicted nucleic acid-binding protein